MNERSKKGSLKGLICSVDGCDEPMNSRKMCIRHYKQWHRTGEVSSELKGMHGSPDERFWHFVVKTGVDDCWEWNGRRDKDGYGSIRTKTSQVRAHRLSYQMHKGEIPDGMLVRHACNNPPCVNPRHLIAGTQTENMADRKIAGNAPDGERHPNCKFSYELVQQVRAAIGKRKDIAKQFGISESQVGNIRSFAQRKNG